MKASNEKKKDLKGKLLHELREYLQNFIYLAIFFSVFAIYRRLLLEHYGYHLEDYGVSVIKALILAKLVMIGDILHIGRRLAGKAIIYVVLIKSLAFTIWVAIFDVLESFVRAYIDAKTLHGAYEEFINHFDGVLVGGLLVVYFAFVPFFALKELGIAVGKDKLHQLFFKEGKNL